MLDTEILSCVLNEERYSMRHTSLLCQLQSTYEDMERKFKGCLPEQLQEAFDDLMEIRSALEFESENIAKAAGMRIAEDLHSVLSTPVDIMEKRDKRGLAPFQVYAKEIANITRIYENMNRTEV